MIGAAGLSLAGEQLLAQTGPGRQGIIDTHTHFYDATRPQGVTWPPATDKVLYRKVLPDEHRGVAAPHGVVGTVVVEASAWLEDNQWLLDLANQEPRWILGVVGRLAPGQHLYREQLVRFAAHPCFRGIRISGQRHRLDDPAVIADLRLLVEADLSLDVNCDHQGLDGVIHLSTALPDLRIIVNHFANVPIDGRQPPREWAQAIRAVARHPNVVCKFSRFVEAAGFHGGEAPLDPAFYRPVADVLWDAFGEDRLVYGSNWPVCTRFAPYEQVQRLAVQLLDGRSSDALSKLLVSNPRRFYQLA